MHSVIRFVQAVWALMLIMLYNAALFSHLFFVKRKHVWRGTYGTAAYLGEFTFRQTFYADLLLSNVCRALDITFRFTGVDCEMRDGPFIVVSNHQSTIDIPAVYAGLSRLKWSLTSWVMKRELERTPYGWAGKETGAAFVDRDGGENDLPAIRVAGRWARLWKAAIVIFVEGTRFKRAVPDSGLTCVLPPKMGGFLALCEELPNAPIVSITLRWSGSAEGLGLGRTIHDVMDLIGRTLEVDARFVHRSELKGDPRAWLREEWKRKDTHLVIRARED